MITCDAPSCVRGLVHLPGGFADPCPICHGKGELHLAEVSRLIDENEATLTKLLRLRGRMRSKVCRRILDKLALVLWPEAKKQPELFA